MGALESLHRAGLDWIPALSDRKIQRTVSPIPVVLNKHSAHISSRAQSLRAPLLLELDRKALSARTEHDGQCFRGFAFLLGRRFFSLLTARLVHFVNGESRAGRLMLFAFFVHGIASAAATSAAVASLGRLE